MRAAVVVEGAHPHALLAQQVEVDVGHRAAVAVGEAVGLGEQDAVLVDHRLTVPRQVGRRLALAGGGVDVGGQAARGLRRGMSSLRSSARPTVIGLPERLSSTVAPASAASLLGGTGTHRSSQISACTTSPGTSRGLEEQVRAERHVLAADGDLAAHVVADGDLAALVELAVRRQVGLRHDAEDAAAVHDERAVVDPVAMAQRRADDEHRQQPGRALDDRGQRVLDAVEDGVLEQQVLDRVAAQGQLGEDGHRRRPPRRTRAPSAARPRRWPAGRRRRCARCRRRPGRSRAGRASGSS